MNIAKYLKTTVLENVCEWLLERFPTWASNITSNMGIEKDIFSETKHGFGEDIFSKTKEKEPFKI